MRKLSFFWKFLVSVLSVSLVLFHMYTTYFGILPDIYQRNIHLGFVLTLCFILKPASKNSVQNNVPFYDIAFAVLSVASAVYILSVYSTILWDPLEWVGPLDKVFAVTTCLLVLEAGRRTVGMVFIVLASFFFLYALYGPYFPGMWGHGGYNLNMILQTLYHSTNGLWGTMTGISATLLALFAIFSAVLDETGGAETFVKIGQKIVGEKIGGQGKVALIASGLFGMISGSAMANVMATGSFTIPMMKKAGYTKEWAAAISAVGSSGGQIMPPIMGAGAFIMAQILGVSYVDIAVAASFPAFLYYLSAFATVHLISLKSNIKSSGAEKVSISFSRYIVVIMPILVFLYFLILRYTVDIAALWASIAGFFTFMLVFALTEKKSAIPVVRHGFSLAHRISLKSASSILSMAALLVSAQIVITLIQLSGFGIKMSNLILSVGENNLLLCLLLSMIVCAILGMGLPTTAAYVLAAAVLVPPLIGLGVAPLVAHLFVFYYSTLATITPPVCAAVYLSAGMAEADWLKTGILSVLMALPVFIVPYAFAYNRILIFDFVGENLFSILFAFATALLGVVSIAVGVVGYNKRELAISLRALAVIGGILMVIPMAAPSAIGLILFAGVYFTSRGKKSPAIL